MWKVSKRPITFVLIAIMAAGNALPAWADSGKRTPETTRANKQDNLRGSNDSLTAPIAVGDCDNYYDLLILQARATAANAKALARLTESQAQLALATGLNEFLSSVPRPTEEAITDYYTNYMALSQALADVLRLALDAIDAALALAIAALELAKAICNGIY